MFLPVAKWAINGNKRFCYLMIHERIAIRMHPIRGANEPQNLIVEKHFLPIKTLPYILYIITDSIVSIYIYIHVAGQKQPSSRSFLVSAATLLELCKNNSPPWTSEVPQPIMLLVLSSVSTLWQTFP